MILGSAAVQFYGFANPSCYNNLVFGRTANNSDGDELKTLKFLGLFISIYLLVLAYCIMTYRVTTGKSNPASGKDNLMITIFNRIITNTIEQTVIFVGFYINILFDDDLDPKIILLICSLFIIGRVAFAGGYILGGVTKITTFRSFGVSINFTQGIAMMLYFFGFNLYGKFEDIGHILFGNWFNHYHFINHQDVNLYLP